MIASSRPWGWKIKFQSTATATHDIAKGTNHNVRTTPAPAKRVLTAKARPRAITIVGTYVRPQYSIVRTIEATASGSEANAR